MTDRRFGIEVAITVISTLTFFVSGFISIVQNNLGENSDAAFITALVSFFIGIVTLTHISLKGGERICRS